MKKFESRERLSVSEQSLSRDARLENTPPSPISLNNKLVTRSPDQKDNERNTLSDQSVTTTRPERIRQRPKYLDDSVTNKLCTRSKGKVM